MSHKLIYCIIAALLVVIELLYFKIADKYKILDIPNIRSSHIHSVRRGGGIVFIFGLWLWCLFFGFIYPWMTVAVTFAAFVSFVDDIHPLPYSLRLIAQFVAVGLMFIELDLWHLPWWWVILSAAIVCVGAANIYNFMDGINGITGGYSLAILIPLYILNLPIGFIDYTMILVIAIAVLVFCYFNYRPKAKCFTGDVGSISIAFIMLFCLCKLIQKTSDLSWTIFLIVYGVDGCLTIIHRIMLHENLREGHRKHAFQIMANELKIPHVVVSTIYAVLQFTISMVMVLVVPNNTSAHWIYFVCVLLLLSVAYILFMKKYYHLHEAYLTAARQAKETASKAGDGETDR